MPPGRNSAPVANVDLGKYGLSMPVIDPRPDKRYRGAYAVTFPHDSEGWTPPPFDPAVSQPQGGESRPRDSGMAGTPSPTLVTEPPQPAIADGGSRGRSPSTWLYFGIGILILGIGATFYFTRKKNQK